ncbi:MAG: hypothetical protein AAGG51_13625 [Cyanobacteria bacterium P01_G01_bin.54]
MTVSAECCLKKLPQAGGTPALWLTVCYVRSASILPATNPSHYP